MKLDGRKKSSVPSVKQKYRKTFDALNMSD